MQYWLLIKSGCSFPDFEDECEANSIDEAANTFLMKNRTALREFDKEMILPHICEEPEAIPTSMI